MTQNELFEHLISVIRNVKCQLISSADYEENRLKIRQLNDTIGTLKIYREMRKIISMSFEEGEDVLQEL